MLTKDDLVKRDIEGYITSVDTLAKGKEDFVFATTTPENAAIVISKIIEYSNAEVKIYEHSLDGDIADKHPAFYKSVQSFLKKGKVLKILLREEVIAENGLTEFLAEASDLFPSQIVVRIASEQFRKNLITLIQKDVNFAVNDNKAYRIELDDVKENKDSMCNFNDEAISTKLTNVFDQGFESCEPHRILDLSN